MIKRLLIGITIVLSVVFIPYYLGKLLPIDFTQNSLFIEWVGGFGVLVFLLCIGLFLFIIISYIIKG